MSKTFVEVNVNFSAYGEITPVFIKWENGRTFAIDKITDARKSASLKCGGIGMRYTCFIMGKRVYLYKENDKWFLES